MVSPSSDRISRAPPYSRISKFHTPTGLSPSLVSFSTLFRFLLRYPSAGPISLATTFGVSVDFLSCRYLDVSVPCVRSLYTMYSCQGDPHGPGSPIRISADQSLFTAPRSFSQCITSFFASDCLGIHQMLLLRLILLRINNLLFQEDHLYYSVKSTRFFFSKKRYIILFS